MVLGHAPRWLCPRQPLQSPCPTRPWARTRYTVCLRTKLACSCHVSSLNCGLHGSVKVELEKPHWPMGAQGRELFPRPRSVTLYRLLDTGCGGSICTTEMDRGCKSAPF